MYIVRKSITRLFFLVDKLLSKYSWYIFFTEQFIKSHLNNIQTVEHTASNFTAHFFVSSSILKYRANTFSSKEPDTLKWIDSMPMGSVLWDIGANVGLYSIYAAKTVDAKVIAFEPSVFNLEWLARNVQLNCLQSKISVVPIALSNECGLNRFRMSNTSWGGALSTFSEKIDQNGNDLRVVFEYETVGLTLAAAYKILSLPKPLYMKIDVDGIEHFILRGAGEVLAYPRQILVEVNENFSFQAFETAEVLREAGFRLENKFSLGLPNQYNQLWCR